MTFIISITSSLNALQLGAARARGGARAARTVASSVASSVPCFAHAHLHARAEDAIGIFLEHLRIRSIVRTIRRSQLRLGIEIRRNKTFRWTVFDDQLLAIFRVRAVPHFDDALVIVRAEAIEN